MKKIYIILLILISLPVNASGYQPLPTKFSEFYFGMSLDEFKKITGVDKSDPCHHCSKSEEFYSIGAPKPDGVFHYQEYSEFKFINKKLYTIGIGLYGNKSELLNYLKLKYGPASKIEKSSIIWESKEIYFKIHFDNEIATSIFAYSKKIKNENKNNA